MDFLVKWNPRATDVAGLAARLDADGAAHWEHPRAGKRVTTWEQPVAVDGIERPVRRVLRLIERVIDAGGQALIEPRLTLEGWTTSLPATQFSAKAAVALYADHGTHEQFHSEFKTDLDPTRLPRATRGAREGPLPGAWGGAGPPTTAVRQHDQNHGRPISGSVTRSPTGALRPRLPTGSCGLLPVVPSTLLDMRPHSVPKNRSIKYLAVGLADRLGLHATTHKAAEGPRRCPRSVRGGVVDLEHVPSGV